MSETTSAPIPRFALHEYRDQRIRPLSLPIPPPEDGLPWTMDEALEASGFDLWFVIGNANAHDFLAVERHSTPFQPGDLPYRFAVILESTRAHDHFQECILIEDLQGLTEVLAQWSPIIMAATRSHEAMASMDAMFARQKPA